MRNISYKIAPDLIQPLQFRDFVANYDGASRLVGSLLDRNSGDFDVPLAMGSRIGKAQLAAHRFAGAQRFRNQPVQRCVADLLKQRDANGWLSQFEQFLERSIHERNAPARVNDKQTILHRAKNRLRAGFAPCDLALEFLLPGQNALQRKANAFRLCSAINQKSGRPFAAGYLCNELLNLWPWRGPFSPENQRGHCECGADQTQD